MRSNPLFKGRRIAASIALTALAGCGGASLPGYVDHQFTPSPRPTFAPPPSSGPQYPPSGQAYVGAFAKSEPGLRGLEVAVFPSPSPRAFALSMQYQDWVTNFPGVAEDTDLSYGRYSVESWNCGIPDAELVAGGGDLLLQTRAQAIKGFGHTVFLRYLWQMNEPTTLHFGPSGAFSRSACYDPATDNPDTTLSPSQFIAAWAHVREIFAQEGANNVVWVWDVSGAHGSAEPTQYYPGNNLVDWIGLDLYDTKGVGFVNMLNTIYPALSQYNKPILIAETGETPSLQPAFFGAVEPALNPAKESLFPLVLGFMYYDGQINGIDWSLDRAGTTAFSGMANTPLFAAKGTP